MDSLSREKMILQYLPLVAHVARRYGEFAPPQVSLSDLNSVGSVALIQSVDRFDAKHASGASFKSYCYRAIANACMDEIRQRRSVVRMPRRLQPQNDVSISPDTAAPAAKSPEPSPAVIALRRAIAYDLTARQRYIVRALTLGQTQTDIARDLGLSTQCVSQHWAKAKKVLAVGVQQRLKSTTNRPA